ncbi:hypothetical protein CAC42_2437 [Sphaceloma murrayae]|uniref:Phenol 2-monooxygenase n=1 Tax=Sphaceloma murrayae TaxID=2082308 RepID=A0A2K1QWC7_9PEZI|nr:hypothetical protein CAC42_2437 [Sphaceloma murrayae]
MHLQFHHSSYRPGSPTLSPDVPTALPAPRPLPREVDVLIVGAGPAGLTLAAQLSQFSDISVALAEQKQDRLKVGQADGIQCRSIEIFESFGFAERVLREGYWVNETVFWGVSGGAPGGEKGRGIVRSGRTRDVPEGLSEFPHIILNQARIHDFWLDVMRKGARPTEPYYGKALVGLKREGEGGYPVEATFETETIRAKYVVGCDGARSSVRSQLGVSLQGDSASQAWGVMDVICLTTFPDIRFKCVIQSESGNIVIIPREGGYLVRLYIELGDLPVGSRIRDLQLTKEDLIKKAQDIFRPYAFEAKDIYWWSAYEIGQRLCPHFDDSNINGSRDPRIFIMGDACHTHSPKAGQGMNVSMQDGYNMGWKLASVLRGLARPELLRTYATERYAIAKELIDFDRELLQMYGKRAKQGKDEEKVDPKEFERYFTKSLMYTSGMGYSYPQSAIIASGVSAPFQSLASGFPVGERFHSHPVVRFFDAKPIQLGHTVRSDGRWRLFLFSDSNQPFEEIGATVRSKLVEVCNYLLGNEASPLVRYRHSTPKTDHYDSGHPNGIAIAPPDSVIEILAVLQQPHDVLQTQLLESGASLPAVLTPKKGVHGLTNMHNIFCDEKPHYNIWGATVPWQSIYDARGVSREDGAMIVVRPDGYVAAVLPLEIRDGKHDLLQNFFSGFMNT